MKTSKLLAMSMALCLGATSAFAIAPPNDDCTAATLLTVGSIVDHNCLSGTNIDATLEATAYDTITASCWAGGGDADATVWYKFEVINSGSYTITTDVSDGSSPDTQLQLFSTPNDDCDSLTAVIDGCGEDDGSCYGLAAEITATLSAGKYYVQVDIYGPDQGDFKIGVIDNNSTATEAYDCIKFAVPITADINAITGSKHFSCKNYNYFNVTQDEITISGSSYSGCNTPIDSADLVYFGVWFEFVVDQGVTKDTWISVQGVDLDKCDNGASADIFYTMHLFEGSGSSQDCALPITNLTPNDCSIGDGLGTNGGSLDKACGSFFDHPRLNIAELGAGTYSVMVAQMTRATVDFTTHEEWSGGFDPLTGDSLFITVVDTTTTIAGPSNGIFELLIEAAPDGNYSIDTISADNCANAKDVTGASYAGLTNAGLVGNLNSVTNQGTCQPAPAPGEPLEYIYSGATWQNDEHCDSTSLTGVIDALDRFNNNSAVYSFTVADPILDDEILCYEGSELKELILTTFDLLCDTVLIIYPDNFPVIYNPITGGVLVDLPGILSELDEDEDGVIAIPDEATCQEIHDLLEEVLCLILGPLPQVCIPLNCSPTVNISFCNITMCGNEDNGAAVYVTAGDCVSGSEVLYAPIENGTTALTINTAVAPLPPGTYYLVVDGHGAVLGYDLEVEISYSLGLGGAPCGPSASPSAQRPASSKDAMSTLSNFSVNDIYPVPATDELTVIYTLEKEVASVKVSVIDMTGKEVILATEVASTEGLNRHTLNVAELNAGMYMISIEGGQERLLSRFTKAD